MSSDDFGTVNLKRNERAREIEVMRQHYRRHRETLNELATDAPTEYLANEYRRLIQEVEISLGKLDELEGRVTMTPPASAGAGIGAATAATAATITSSIPPRTEPGRRTLNPPPAVIQFDDDRSSPGSRLILILIAGLLVLGALGWLIWRASSEERPITPVVSESSETPETETVAAASPRVTEGAAALAVEPPAHDYGVVRKGTRAARQFEVVNSTDAPISIKVSRSNCRCLYYDYGDVIPPNGRETLTVTVDGAKAEVGQLQEAITIASNANASQTTTFNVNATIR